MRERNAYLYFKKFGAQTFDKLVEVLLGAGFSQYQPETGDIMAIRTESDIESEDDLIGDQFAVSPDWLAARIEARITTSLDWWATDWSTLFSTIRFGQPIDELFIALNGIAGDQLEQPVLGALQALFKDAIRHDNAVGMVIDPQGITEDYDWYAFFADESHTAAPLPQVIGLPNTALDRLAPAADRAKTELQGFSIVAEQDI